jgi:hypothetical protein
MMNKRLTGGRFMAMMRLSSAAAVVLISGCVAPSPSFDDQFGQTVPTLRAQQIANPQAAIENQERAVTGMDGRAAREAVDRYYKSFREPPAPTNVFTIGVGAGSE